MNDVVLELKYIGKSDWDYPTYIDQNEKIWFDIEYGRTHKPSLCSSSNNELDGEPNNLIDQEYIIAEPYIRDPKEHEYRMLSRLKADCDYYLGYGGRYAWHLWAGNEADQIAKMKEMHNSFTEDEKPEWLTWEELLEYERQMIAQ